MNSRQQATKGFKTFLLTLVISLIIFSGIYYLINSQQEEDEYYGSDQEQLSEFEDVLGSESDEVSEEEMEEIANETGEEEESVFADLANQEMENGSQRQVLAGADSGDTTATTSDTTSDTTAVATTTTVSESTVPETGASGPTMGLVMTLIILGFAGYIMFLGPRNVALHNFEKDTIDDLE
jgi:Na+-transporting NADH:ubiquinone oxidoreductase subunit NqrC